MYLCICLLRVGKLTLKTTLRKMDYKSYFSNKNQYDAPYNNLLYLWQKKV